ncbi:hypothetical protein BYT27DRAFT_7184551 [Phlegmacium glaucopus]|nr:hypothetical protein BYT27DRAFT_7184551 [Phlegmacium glaucopus]
MDQRGTYPAFVPTTGVGNHPWVQGQRIQGPEEQVIPSRVPFFVSHINLPSTSYTQNRVVNHNHESIMCEQQPGVGIMDRSCQLTIPTELLDEQFVRHQALPAVGLKEIIFLGPHPDSAQHFLNSRDVFITRVMQVLEKVQSLKKVTFSLDLTHLGGIFATLAAIPDMEEIVLTLPTTFTLQPHSVEMLHIQNAFVNGLKSFGHLKRLTIPTELVTAFMLSFLANLPCLESLTVKSSPLPGPSNHQHPFPAWSTYRAQAECPGFIFLTHLSGFDPRGHFKQLSHLELGAPLTESSYATLKVLFPKAHIC